MTDVTPDVCDLIPTCPVCGGKMELVYDRPAAKVCVCRDCHTGISVPGKALSIARQKGRLKDEDAS